MWPTKHKCCDAKIRCFDCREKICTECMVVSKDSLRCKRCANNGKKGESTANKGKRPSLTLVGSAASNGTLMMKMSGMAFLGSFIAAKFLSALSCVS